MGRQVESPFLPFPIHPISNATVPSLQFQIAPLPPLPNCSSNSPRMDSDDSNQTVLNTISIFKNSEVETPDEFLDSESNPFYFSQHSFQSITPPIPVEPSFYPFSHTEAAPMLSPLSSNPADAPSPVTDDRSTRACFDEFISY